MQSKRDGNSKTVVLAPCWYLAMSERRSAPEMVAELLREAGMLMIVFVPLDLMFSDHIPRWYVVIIGIISGLVFIYLGVDLERKR